MYFRLNDLYLLYLHDPSVTNWPGPCIDVFCFLIRLDGEARAIQNFYIGQASSPAMVQRILCARQLHRAQEGHGSTSCGIGTWKVVKINGVDSVD